MKSFLFYFVTILCLLACNETPVPKQGKDAVIVDYEPQPVITDTAIKDHESTKVDTSVAVTTASKTPPIIYDTVSFKKMPIVKLGEKISTNLQSVHLLLTDVMPCKLNISIGHSKPNANIRISQILMPDGSSDGPFGQKMKFEATQKGNYTIIINKSNMASGTQIGDVFISIKTI